MPDSEYDPLVIKNETVSKYEGESGRSDSIELSESESRDNEPEGASSPRQDGDARSDDED